MEQLKKGKIYSGFKLKKIEDVKEINSKAYEFKHIKTKAKLIFISNEKQEKTFSITFRTPPYDNTGLPHILEHSVLCGSKNYPIKDLFGQVAKSSINSFINAFTFPDKTMYPFSTTNNFEFQKIMRVYLDAVFFPNIYKHKEIFMQEGWRYELENEKADLKYSGVVYGEMKGALSGASRIMDSNCQRELFPNTCYGVESGGDPKYIIDLRYEQFLEFHKKYYHPTNSYIYIYGNTNIIEDLKLIDEEYLSKFEKIKINSKIKFQKPTKTKHKTIEYPISKTEEKENKYLFGKYYVIDKATNNELMLGFDILSSILLDYESSPLKKALIKSQIAEDIDGGFMEDMIYQPIFSIEAVNSKIENKEKFEKIINQTFEKLVKEKIDKNLITAALNKKEFSLKEENYIDDGMPKSILINIKIMDSWLYDDKPLKHIKYYKNLEKIKSKANKNYFENLIKKYLIKNKHNILLTLEPNQDLNEQEKIEHKLKEMKSKLSKKEIETIINETKKVKQFQENEDTKKELDTLKILELNKIDRKPKKIELIKIKLEDIEIYEYRAKTNGIDYFNFFFDIKTIPQEKIQYLYLLTQILKETKTKNYTSEEFANLINTYTGDLNYLIAPFETTSDKFKPKFVLSTKILENNYEKLTLILNEIFNNVEFDEQKLKEIIKKTKSRYEESFITAGHIYAITKLESMYSQTGKYNEIISGIEFYKFIKNLDKNFSKNKKEIIKNLKEIYELIFNKNNLIINITSQNFKIEKLNQLKIKNNKYIGNEYKFKLDKENTAFVVQSQVNYVAKGYNFKKLKQKYNGNILVLRNLLRYGYLWENIRIKGGAYGAFAKITKTGNFELCSYRDPNIKRTLNVYDSFSKYLKNLKLDEKEFRKYIIGIISDIDKPLCVEDESIYQMSNIIKEISYEDLINEREEILTTRIEDIKKLSNIIKDIMDKNYHITIGNSNSIEKDKKLFDKIENL